MKTAICIVLLAAAAWAGPVKISNPRAVAQDRATKEGLTDIQSCKTNLTACLDKLGLALDEAKALPASATKTALVDLAQSTKQLAQATRDLMQAIKKMNRDNSP